MKKLIPTLGIPMLRNEWGRYVPLSAVVFIGPIQDGRESGVQANKSAPHNIHARTIEGNGLGWFSIIKGLKDFDTAERVCDTMADFISAGYDLVGIWVDKENRHFICAKRHEDGKFTKLDVTRLEELLSESEE